MQRYVTALAGILLVTVTLGAQQPDAKQVAQERARAELEVPQLAELLNLKPGMTAADVGAGFGATTVVMAKWLGGGKVYATDIGERQLNAIREYAEKEGLKNVTVLPSAPAATNLPAGCCDGIFMRDVYHHITAPVAFDKSLLASVKPGGRLAIIDFLPRANSAVPEGVPSNRGGHGVTPAIVVEEMKAAGFTHVRTYDEWPPGDKNPFFLCLFSKP